MEDIRLYRKRFIPDETVYLKDDIIEHIDDEIIITRWEVLRPKKEFVGGRSCYFLKEGYKVSRFFDSGGKCIYTYCDVISVSRSGNDYVFSDLLIDIVVYEDGAVKVLDLAEVSEALEQGLITVEMAKEALRLTDSLLDIIYSGGFARLTQYLEDGNGGRTCTQRSQTACAAEVYKKWA